MKVFYNKNKLLYNLELFLVYILSYGWLYAKAFKRPLVDRNFSRVYETHDDWLTSPKSVCCKALSYNFSKFFFLIKHFGNIWIQSPRLIGFSYLDEFSDCAFLCLSSICEHVLFGLGWCSFVYHRVHSRLVWFKERESTRITKSGRRKAREVNLP